VLKEIQRYSVWARGYKEACFDVKTPKEVEQFRHQSNVTGAVNVYPDR